MFPARTAAPRTGPRRTGRGVRRGVASPGVVTAAALAAYLSAVFIPAWHSHGPHGDGETAHCEAAGGETPAAGCERHHEHHPGHDHPPAEPAGEAPADAPHDHGHDCPVCDLTATAATPADPPAVADLGEAAPAARPPLAADRRAVFLRTRHARGPPRG